MKTNNLRKQEEKTFFNGGDICDTCGQKMKDIGNGGYTHNCHTPKVATSEKEGIPLHCKHCGKVTSECEEFKKAFDPTPHESEDWEGKGWAKELLSRFSGEILNQYQDKYLMEKGPGCEEVLFPVLEKAIKDFLNPPEDGFIRTFSLKDYIQAKEVSVESKAYQRGREEVYNTRYEKGLQDGKRVYVQEFIAIAVQEIEKEKKELPDHKHPTFEVGFNQGLDKAKSIISQLMKK